MTSLILKLQFLKSIRSVSIVRNLVGGFFLGILLLIVLSYLLLLAFSLEKIIVSGFGEPDVIAFLNAHLAYFFILEIMYRFFLQKLPVIELENFLHLPIGRSKIIHFLLVRSFISPLSIITLILFIPITLTEVREVFDLSSALYWLSSIALLSWTLHWFMHWFKQKYGNKIISLLMLFGLFIISTAANYYGWFNIGEFISPIFQSSLESPLPALILLMCFFGMYAFTFRYYKKHAYIEELSIKSQSRYIDHSLDFLSRFGLAGEIADLEWKLILRHKKSRNYLFISFLFLFYGLLFYNDPSFTAKDGFSYFFIFTGIFITGIFFLQYGQLFLSWNSTDFDFFISRREGLKALIKGKYLLFVIISILCFLLSVPYVYFGWDVLFIHMATFLFNMGITIHLVIYLSLWKPKPMNLNKGALFNYEGIGMAQFLMIIPMGIAPYVIFLPFAIFINDYAGLAALSIIGIIGILFYEKLSDAAVSILLNNKYEISSTFREEL